MASESSITPRIFRNFALALSVTSSILAGGALIVASNAQRAAAARYTVDTVTTGSVRNPSAVMYGTRGDRPTDALSLLIEGAIQDALDCAP